MPAAPILESPGAQRPAEESTAATGGLGSGERLALTADESATVPGVTAGATGSSEADVGVADATPKPRAEKPVEPEEQAALPETSEGVVGHAMRPPSP